MYALRRIRGIDTWSKLWFSLNNEVCLLLLKGFCDDDIFFF
jgi:hypothetical protein